MAKAQELVMRNFAGLRRRTAGSRGRSTAGCEISFGDFLNPISGRQLNRIAEMDKVTVVVTKYGVAINGITRNRDESRTVRRVEFSTLQMEVNLLGFHTPTTSSSTRVLGNGRNQQWSMRRGVSKSDPERLVRTRVSHTYSAGRRTTKRSRLGDKLGDMDLRWPRQGDLVERSTEYPHSEQNSARNKPTLVDQDSIHRSLFYMGHVTHISKSGKTRRGVYGLGDF
jgi:hypothetical protein